MRAGRLDLRATFKRRLVISPRERGEFTPYLSDWPAGFRRSTGDEAVQGGQVVNVEQGLLTVRDSTETRGIVSSDRVEIEGRDHAIRSVSLPDRRSRTITVAITTDLGET